MQRAFLDASKQHLAARAVLVCDEVAAAVGRVGLLQSLPLKQAMAAGDVVPVSGGEGGVGWSGGSDG